MSLAPISVSASRAALALGSPDFRPASRAAAPWPPVLAIGLAVEHALARDRQLLLTVGVNQGRVVQQLGSFPARADRSEEHTSELQSLRHLVCRLLLEKKKKITR